MITISLEDRERIAGLIAETAGYELSSIVPETHLAAGLNMDETDRIELFMDLEDEFNIDISEEDEKKVNTVQDVFDLVAKKSGSA